jgi:murein DD-endopeptidase MepM/ murein hydrolase activator NlpD
MNVNAVDQFKLLDQATDRNASPEKVRDAAVKFEALLLNQLTSILNRTAYDNSENGEESLFGNDGGADMAKQLFSEQLATTIAEAGGLGLADVIMRQFGVEPEKGGPVKGLADAASAMRSIKESKPTAGVGRAERNTLLERLEFKGDPNDAEVISTFEDEARRDGIEESLRHLILDGKIVNTTRARLADAPINDITPAALTTTREGPLAYQFPVSGRLTSDFGNRVHPIDRTVKFHAGLDLAVPRGTSVEASADGTVSFAGWKGGYGNLLVIKHADGKETRYGHLDKLNVKEGDEVKAGQEVALSGSTGKSTGPHLHFEIRENGQVLNPLGILTKGLR